MKGDMLGYLNAVERTSNHRRYASSIAHVLFGRLVGWQRPALAPGLLLLGVPVVAFLARRWPQASDYGVDAHSQEHTGGHTDAP